MKNFEAPLDLTPPPAAADFLSHDSPALQQFMARMAPHPEVGKCDGISLTGAMMCQIMVLNSVMERNGNRLLEEHGLTMPQWLALGCISHAGEEGISHSQIGQRLMLSKAPITGIVDRLERAKLVERRADAKDRRVSRAVALPRGLETWSSGRNALQGHVDRAVADSLTIQEQELLLRLVGRLLDAFTPADGTVTDTKAIDATATDAIATNAIATATSSLFETEKSLL